MAVGLSLAACAESPDGPGVGGIPPAPAMVAPTTAPVGALLPLSGPMSGFGHQMLDAMHLALPSGPNAPEIDAHDTAAPGGAEAATRAAISHGDRLLMGPLTAADTAASGPLAAAAAIPELAFTSDDNRAQPGVWVLGLTPLQQVRRMVMAAKTQGRQHFAAFLPDNALGHSMGQSLVQVCADAGLAPPNVVYHGATTDAIRSSLNTLAATGNRQPAAPPAPAPVDPTVDPTGMTQAPIPSPAATPSKLAPPPFDALLLADTGVQLADTISALQAAQITTGTAQFMGPALWDSFASKLGALHGAWYAAPDQTAAAHQGFARSFRTHYQHAPVSVAYLAFDSAAIAGIMAKAHNNPARLTQAQGFAGSNGVFALLPDGHVARSLAIFAIQPGGGAKIVVPAPADAHS